MDLSLNERRLVELVASGPGIARVDLARLSGMTGASVTRLTAGLLESGVFTERTDRSGGHGQPKKILSLKTNRFHAAGITYSLSEMEVALIDFSGEALSSKTLGIEGCGTDEIAELAARTISNMRSSIGINNNSFVGVGCSAPGNFGPLGSDIRAHQLFTDFDKPEKVQLFGQAFEVPFFLENDGSAAALGEHVFGRQDTDGNSLFLIHIGYGLGGGAVIDGKLFRGASGNACLPGVLFPYGGHRPTAQDLLEFLSSKGLPIQDLNSVTYENAALKDAIHEWIERAALQLRHAIRVTTGFFDPSTIIIGGRLPSDLNDRLVQEVLKYPMDGPSRGLKVAPVRASTLGPKAGAVGAACIPLFRTFFTGENWDAGNNHLNGRRPQSVAGTG